MTIRQAHIWDTSFRRASAGGCSTTLVRRDAFAASLGHCCPHLQDLQEVFLPETPLSPTPARKVQTVRVPSPILALLGPTASGKSRLGVRLAVHLRESGRPAEIVNADSMLVYRGMDIGTAKPTLDERGGVPHHLVDILDVRESATVADFQRLARAAIASCQQRGVLPILVGGSALYLRAILDEFAFPGTDPDVRAELEAELAVTGPQALYERLSRLAPEAAAGIEPMNGRRVVRALEVVALTGSYRATLPEHRYALPGVVQVGLALDRATMDARIDARVDEMWRRGLVAEVRGLA
ncbi:MAG: tRNA (adenosine(37)-N6)-dimethylallyltransferase MiaA, partial [Actinobacteria bacterium]|nr:tRNA (adenosine(37)-N6)-dimethylallyltransferase MiaA [Actinomycetota bacterium]